MIAQQSAVEKLREASYRNRSLLCVGLDPDPDRFPHVLDASDDPIGVFNRAIIDATRDLVCAYKLNLAFFEVHGLYGWQALEATVAAIPPDVPVILDAKRGDIGHTARQYARALFEHLGADAVTVNPYMGRDGIQPFLDYADRMTILLAATSNPGAEELQGFRNDEGVPLYRYVARMGAEMHGKPGAIGLVAGATRPERLAEIRSEAPDQWLLVPGVGAQGGDLAACMEHGLNPDGSGVMINASRAVTYASRDLDYAAAARRQAEEIRDAINHCRR